MKLLILFAICEQPLLNSTIHSIVDCLPQGIKRRFVNSELQKRNQWKYLGNEGTIHGTYSEFRSVILFRSSVRWVASSS